MTVYGHELFSQGIKTMRSKNEKPYLLPPLTLLYIKDQRHTLYIPLAAIDASSSRLLCHLYCVLMVMQHYNDPKLYLFRLMSWASRYHRKDYDQLIYHDNYPRLGSYYRVSGSILVSRY